MRLSEQQGIVYVLKPGDHQAGVDGDSFSLKQYGHATFLIQFAALTGDGVLTIESGASAGTKTTAESFRYRLADAVQGSATADTFAAWTAAATLTLTAATYANKMLVVEIDAIDLTADQPWVTLALSAAADALNAAIVAILSEPKYSMHDMPTAIA